MEVTFKYNGKIISTPNLEKKLKRMKLSYNDIEIVESPAPKKEEISGVEDFILDKEKVIIRSTQDDIRRICYVKKGERPPFDKLFNKVKWNGKTGIKGYTDEFFKTMYYEY